MADPSDRISQLKIDRNAPPASTGRPLWPIAAAVIVVGTIGAWLFFGTGSAAITVETDTARQPPSAAAESSVLDASG